jgi:hypothetical protein
MTDRVFLSLGIAAALAAAIPIFAYPFAEGTRLDPYRNRSARWVVYVGACISLTAFIVLSLRSG